MLCFVTVLLLLCNAAAAQAQQTGAAEAVQLIRAGDYAGAAALLKPLAKQSPDDPDLWNLLGVCESEMNHTEAARDAFLAGLKAAPASLPLNENLGYLYFRQADFAHAKTYLQKAVSLGSEKPGVAFSLAASRIRTGDEKEGLADLVHLEPQLAREPSYWTERGWAELRSDPKAAAACFDRALDFSPNDVRALNGAASAAEVEGEGEKAIAFLLRAKQARPDDIRTLLHLTSICLRRDLSVDAKAAVEHAYALAPSNNLAVFLYARTEIAFQQWQHAHELFTEFDRRVPNYAPALYALGWLDVKMNRPEEARQHLEKSLAIDPRLADARFELAQLDLTEGKLDAVEPNLRMVLEIQPHHAKGQIAYGDLMMRRGDPAQAKIHYEAAIAADPKSGPAHYKLSTALMRLDETERAEKERVLGASLNAEALKAAKTVFVLAEPDGTLLTGEPGQAKGSR